MPPNRSASRLPGRPEVDTAPVSPCISVCQLDSAQELCAGCLRTLDEIARWSRFDNAQKRAVLDAVARRRAARDAAEGSL